MVFSFPLSSHEGDDGFRAKPRITTIEGVEGDEVDEEVEHDDVEEDEEEEEEEDEGVTLGFVEKPKNPRSLLRHLFPSKAGAVPAWLDPVNLPPEKSRSCGFCGEPLQFLLQIYAPISEKNLTFHRTLFVFMCPSMSCLLRDQHEQWKHEGGNLCRSVKVLRCQLPRTNPFYSSEPPRRDGTDKPLCAGVSLCCWCGTWKGEKLCGSCRKARYCSEYHQADADKKSWASFQERLARAPEQVLRYCRDPMARPLWPLSIGRPSKADIPSCSYCKGPLCYEFQIPY